jgi:hypothetical protein
LPAPILMNRKAWFCFDTTNPVLQMPPHAPVALFIFNRPDLTAKVFAAIRAAPPEQLFIIADAPRVDRPAEAQLCAEVRAIVVHIDWPCDV